jgi:hypothetical protein
MFKIGVDISDLTSLLDLPDQVKSTLNDLGEKVAEDAYRHTIEQANQKLHTRKETYIQALSISKDDDAWLLVLDESAMWIEEGQSPFDMKPGLLNSPKAKQGKNGKYLVVPFKHDKGTAQTTLTQTVAASMSQNGIPFADIEKGADGNPKTGLLHKFDIAGPNKTSKSPGQGHGPIGSPMQGPSGIPFLKGVNVYQKQGKDKMGKPRTERFIATFRTVSEHSKGWMNNGTEAMNLLDETMEYMMEKFDREIGPKLIASISSKIGK